MVEKKKQKRGDGARVIIGGKTTPLVRRVIEELAREDERSLSNTVSRLLQESPRVRERLEQIQTP